jgi:TolB-like protein/Tfp pilus assembly protein PilF
MSHGLFAELKRRNVFRMAGLYFVGAWLVTQVASTVLPMFGAPEWLPRTIVILLAIGFVPTMIFSWVYELTPEGLKRDADVPLEQSIGKQTGRRIDFAIIAVLLAALAYFAVDKFVLAPRHVAGTADASAERSIAVLPFENLSDEKSNGYFAEGIQDEILTRLAKIGALRVISRTSTQQFASKPGNLAEIARQLGVTNIVEGSVQKAGDAVRVNVQLIRATTDTHLWAEIYDRRLDNLFSVQSEVAGAIAQALQATLTGAEKTALATPPTTNPKAYDAWLRALVYDNRAGEDPAGVELAIAQLNDATTLDPSFAAAWAALSRSHGSQYFQQFDRSETRRQATKAALDRAVALAPDSVDTRTAIGYYQYWIERDYAAAIATFSAIAAKEPNNVDAVQALGFVARRQGRFLDAIRDLDRAVALDPRNVFLITEASWTHGQQRDHDGALKLVESGLNIRPDDQNLRAMKAAIFQRIGRLDEAGRLLDAIAPDGSISQPVFVMGTQARLTRNYLPTATKLQAMVDRIEAGPAASVPPSTVGSYVVLVGSLQQRGGEQAAAAKNLQHARTLLEAVLRSEPQNWIAQLNLALALAGLGERDAAMRTIDEAIEQTPTSKDAVYGPLFEEWRARLQVRFGQRDEPLATMARLLKIGYSNPLTPLQMRVDPDWDPIRDDPRFQMLANSTEVALKAP